MISFLNSTDSWWPEFFRDALELKLIRKKNKNEKTFIIFLVKKPKHSCNLLGWWNLSLSHTLWCPWRLLLSVFRRIHIIIVHPYCLSHIGFFSKERGISRILPKRLRWAHIIPNLWVLLLLRRMSIFLKVEPFPSVGSLILKLLLLLLLLLLGIKIRCTFGSIDCKAIFWFHLWV